MQATQESRWKLPKELRNVDGASKSRESVAASDTSGDRTKVKKQQQAGAERANESRHVIGSKTPIIAAGTLVSDTPDTLVSSGSSKKNALVQRLQASLAGRINPMANMGPPPMIRIPRGDSHSDSVSSSLPSHASADTNGGIGTENGGKVLEEQQYEAETAHMTAAERLRFLRKKRQETMFAKEKIVEEDDFMKEFERNMTKKHDGRFDWRKKREDQHAKEREAKEKEKEEQEMAERQRQQARDEEKAREKAAEREAEKERRRQKEEDEEREREQELVKQEETESEEQKLMENKATCDAAKKKRTSEMDANESDRAPAAAEDGKSRVSTPPHDTYKEVRDSNENGNVNDAVAAAGAEEASAAAQDETEKPDDEAQKKAENENLHQQPKHDKQRRRSEHQDALAQHDGEQDDEAAAAEERQRLKQEKRERRRIAKFETAVAAQSLESSPVKKSKKYREQSACEDNVGAGEAIEQQQQQPPYSSGMYQQYPSSPYGYPPASAPPHSTEGSCSCCRPHPFVPVHVPQMSPFPMYYPYAQPPSPAPMMMMMMGGYAPQPLPPMLLQAPPLSQPGMALVPFAQGQLAAYRGAQAYGVRPTLDRCEGCKGSGVGLVEKNGFCHHCNRLRLDFIVASARIRQRCSVCDGWGLGLVQPASGKCSHCSRRAQQQQHTRGSVLRRQSSGETHQLPPGAVATPFASSKVLKQSGSTRRGTMAAMEEKKLESIEWDQSSDDGSEWDE